MDENRLKQRKSTWQERRWLKQWDEAVSLFRSAMSDAERLRYHDCVSEWLGAVPSVDGHGPFGVAGGL